MQEPSIISFEDSASTDAFGRLRVSDPASLFDSQFQYDLQPLVWEQYVSSGSITHLPNESSAQLFTTGASNSYAILQTYKYFRYQPQKSQLVAMTFAMGNPEEGVVKRVGQFDDSNGIFFEQDGLNGAAIVIRSKVSGSVVEDRVYQRSWNVSKLYGFDNAVLDFTKAQIGLIDYQWLGVGRVRAGLVIGGKIAYLNYFNHANSESGAYTSTMNLPLRYEMRNVSGNTHSSMKAICSSVSSEGGQQFSSGYDFITSGSVIAQDNEWTHLISVQPKTIFNGLVNRQSIDPLSVEVLAIGNAAIEWVLCLGVSLTGNNTFTDVNTDYSGMQFNSGGILSGSLPIKIAGGFVSASATSKSSVERDIASKYPISLNLAGNTRLMGRLSLLVRSVSGTSATRGAILWREIR